MPAMRIMVAYASLGLAVLTSSAVADESARALLQKGTTLYRDASYAAAVATLEQARSGALVREERAEATFYLAAGYVALGSLPAARRELRDLVATTPDFELPRYTSPKVAALFQEAQRDVERQPRLGSLPPRRNSAANRVELRFEASRIQGTAFGSAYVRWKGQPAFTEIPLAHVGEELVASVPLGDGGAKAETRSLEFWATVQSPSGPATLAHPERPLELAVAVPARRSNRSWVWIAVGGTLAGVGLGLGLGLGFGLHPSTPPATDAVITWRAALGGR